MCETFLKKSKKISHGFFEFFLGVACIVVCCTHSGDVIPYKQNYWDI